MADAPSATAVGGRSEQEDLPPARTRRDRPLLRFVLRRLAVTIGLLFGVVTVGFVLINAVPGDPLAIHLSPSALDNPEIVAAFEEKWGLNQPLWQQYLHYLNRLLHGDLGTSQRTGQPVLSNLMDVIPATVEIAIPALVIGVVLGTTFGILSALYRGKLLDQIVRIVALVGLSTPSFWLGLTLLYLFFYRFDLLPSGGRLSPEFEAPPERTGLYTVDGALHQDWTVVADAAWHLVLPVGVLAYLVSVIMVRFVRAAMLDVLGQDFIRAAHAKGLPRGGGHPTSPATGRTCAGDHHEWSDARHAPHRFGAGRDDLQLARSRPVCVPERRLTRHPCSDWLQCADRRRLHRRELPG